MKEAKKDPARSSTTKISDQLVSAKSKKSSAALMSAVNELSQETRSARSKSVSEEQPKFLFKRMVIEGVKWYDENTYTRPPIRKPRTPSSMPKMIGGDRRRLKSKRTDSIMGSGQDFATGTGVGMTFTTISGGPNTMFGELPYAHKASLQKLYGKPPQSGAELAEVKEETKTNFQYYVKCGLIAFIIIVPLTVLATLFVLYFIRPLLSTTNTTATDLMTTDSPAASSIPEIRLITPSEE